MTTRLIFVVKIGSSRLFPLAYYLIKPIDLCTLPIDKRTQT